jgi:hypothetical protein
LVFFQFIYIIYGLYRKGDSLSRIAHSSLLGKSFRINEAEENSALFLFRVLFRAFKNIKFHSVGQQNFPVDDDTNVAFLDSDPKSITYRKYYIKNYTGKNVNKTIFRSEAFFFVSKWQAIKTATNLFLYTVLIYPVYLFNKNQRAAIALTIYELTENNHFISEVKRLNIKKLYIFCIYEKDTNILYLLLKKTGVRVVKISSDGPLLLWNKLLLTDELVVSFSYQMEEAAHMEDTIIYSAIHHWGPEMIEETKNRYPERGKVKNLAHNSIGFYSTASWIRNRKQQLKRGVSIPENEVRILTWLNQYLAVKPQLNLLIFLHPKEKKEANSDELLNWYSQFLGNSRWEFAPIEKPTSSMFDEVKLGVGYYSTVLLERDYYGFETLMSPIGMNNFPIPSSSMESKCVYTEENFIKKLDFIYS